jgi:hypothetical protein
MAFKWLPLSEKAHSVATLVALLSTFAAATACQAAPAGKIELGCQVEGTTQAGSPGAICTAFLKQIEKAVKKPTQLQQQRVAAGNADRIDVRVRILKRGSLIAHVSELRAGKMRDFPEISVDVMDRPMSFRDIETLTTEVAKLVQR